ncbi:MAG: hypothetical protein WC768_04065 [Patescibacteria group bacterium]|jgi:hypothetical protein
MYTYRQIFKEAIKIAWQNPSLWLFGFLVLLLGSTGELEMLLSGYGLAGNSILFSFWSGLAAGGMFSLAGVQGLVKMMSASPVYLFVILLVMLAILGVSVLVVWLITVAQGALVSQVVAVTKNRKLNFNQSWFLGMSKLWPVLGLNVILRAVMWSLFLVTGLIALLKFPGSIFVYIISFDIFLILILVFSFIIKYAICGVILKDWNFSGALKAAWQLFSRNWLLSLEIAIILFLIYFITNALMAFFLALVVVYSLRLYAGFAIGLAIIFFIIVAVFLLIQILLTIFSWAVWSLVFILITAPKRALNSRIASIFSRNG